MFGIKFRVAKGSDLEHMAQGIALLHIRLFEIEQQLGIETPLDHGSGSDFPPLQRTLENILDTINSLDRMMDINNERVTKLTESLDRHSRTWEPMYQQTTRTTVKLAQIQERQHVLEQITDGIRVAFLSIVEKTLERKQDEALQQQPSDVC